MKRASILLAVLLVVAMLSSFAVVAMATTTGSTATLNGVEAQLTTDKDSYTSGATVDARVKLKNGTDKDIFASISINVPSGVKLYANASATAVVVKAGATHTTPGGDNPSTGDNVPMILLSLVAVVAGCGACALMVANKKYKGIMSLLLVVALVGGMGVVAVPAQAADLKDQINLSKTVKVDGKDTVVTATVILGVYTAQFAEDFADLEGWTLDAGASAEGSIAKSKDGELEISAGTAAAAGVTHPLDNYSGKVVFSFDFTPKFTDSKDAGGIMASITGEKAMAISTYAYRDGFGYYDKATSKVVKVGTCVSGETYRVMIVADTDTDTYDMYINSELLAEDITFRNNATHFTRIMHSSTGAAVGTTMKWDNLKISTLSELPVVTPSTPEVNPDTNPDTDPDDPVAPPSLEINGTVLYEDDFADLEGWTGDAGTTATDSYAKVNEAGQLEIHAGTATAAGVSRPLDNYSGEVAFEFLFTPTFTDGKDAGGIMAFIYGVTDSGSTAGAISVYAYSNGFAYYDKNKEGGAGVIKISSTVESGKTYCVQIIANTETDTFDFYVNGEQLAEDVAFRTACVKFSKIMHSTTGAAAGTTLKWDDLVISQLSEVPDTDPDEPNTDPDEPNTDPESDQPTTTPVYSDTFDAMGKWTTMTSDNAADTAVNYVKINDGKLELADDANTRVSAVLKLGQNLTGKVGFEFDVTASALSSTSGLYFTIWGNSTAGNDKLAMDVRMHSDRIDSWTTEFNPVEGTYVENQTYRVKLIADVEANTYSIYIDGTLINEDLAMRNGTISCLNKIRLYSSSDALVATVTYDNLEVYQITE